MAVTDLEAVEARRAAEIAFVQSADAGPAAAADVA